MSAHHTYQAIRDDVLAVTVRYLELAAQVEREHPILAYQLRETVESGRKALRSCDAMIRALAAAGGEGQP